MLKQIQISNFFAHKICLKFILVVFRQSFFACFFIKIQIFQNNHLVIVLLFLLWLSYFLILFEFMYQNLNYKQKNQMQVIQEQQLKLFSSKSKQDLFNTLINHKKYPVKPLSQQDYKVDLVMRIKVPNVQFISKQFQATFDKIFVNVPHEYEKVYQEALDYVHYITVRDPTSRQAQLPSHCVPTRLMTTLHGLKQPVTKKQYYVDNLTEHEEMEIDCQNQYLPFLDSFTVFYNMIVVVLSTVCGFHVRTFIQQNQEDQFQEENETQRKYRGKHKVIYFLISQTDENLMKAADRFEVKKEVDMEEIDYALNQPTDQLQRPIKYNSFFRINQQEYRHFLTDQKLISRLLGIKDINLVQQIFQQKPLDESKAARYKSYLQQVFNQLGSIYKDQHITVNHWEKSFLFNFNRYKINNGCLRLYYEKKIKKIFHERLKVLNRAFGYKYHHYDQSYFEFKMPGKSKPFFQKLKHLLSYKTYVTTKSGQISLFTKLQRIKLCHMAIQKYFKLQNFAAYGIDLYAIHDNFEKYGHLTHQDNIEWKQQHENQDPSIDKTPFLIQVWHPFFPFLSKIKKIRDYMGQNVAIQVMVKVYLTTFFLIITPLSVASQLILTYYQAEGVSYRFCVIQLLIMTLSLNLFISVWQKNESKFFDNFAYTAKNKSFRDGYKGPFFRCLATDDVNLHQQELNYSQRIKTGVCYLIMVTILVCEGLFFWGMRKAIVSTYQKLNLLQWRFVSIPHLCFYGVYFLTNQILYNLFFLKFIERLVNWQMYATRPQHDEKARIYKYVLTFGIQLMGPFFLYIVQPFSGVSCYCSECTQEFTRFIYARYGILFIHIFLKFHKFLYMLVNGMISQLSKDDQKIRDYLPNAQRLNYLLNFIRSQYKKIQYKQDLRGESLSLYYYVIFKIYFPFCSIFTFFFLQLDYIFERVACFQRNRRPIPNTDALYKLQNTFRNILHICIIFNVWTITFSYAFVQYDFADWIQTFVTFIDDQSVFTLKLAVTAVIVLIFEIFSFILRRLFSTLIYEDLQQRKKMIYKKYLYKIREKTIELSLPKLTPIKTIFRTMTYESLMEQKQHKFKIYDKMRMQMQKWNKLSLFQNNNLIGTNRYENQYAGMDSNAIIIRR